MLDWSSCPVVERDPLRVSGGWVFCGTRIPVAALFENLEDGVQISQFVEWFPGVTIEQARAVLDHATKSLTVSRVAWVRILFDQGTPVPLRKLLNSHQVETAFELGWSILTNGKLLEAAEKEGFQVFITTDKNLHNQQNLSEMKIAIIVLSSTSWPRIQKSAEAVQKAIDTTYPGSFKEVGIP